MVLTCSVTINVNLMFYSVICMSTVTGQGLRVKSQELKIRSQESRVSHNWIFCIALNVSLLLFDIDKITSKFHITTSQSNLGYRSYAGSPRLARHTWWPTTTGSRETPLNSEKTILETWNSLSMFYLWKYPFDQLVVN